MELKILNFKNSKTVMKNFYFPGIARVLRQAQKLFEWIISSTNQTCAENTNFCTVSISYLCIVYIHNWSIQPFGPDYWPSFSHHLCSCVNFIHKRRALQFKVNSERQIFFRNFSWQFLFTLRVFTRNLLRGNCQKNTFCILFWCLAWGSNPGFTSNKLPTRLRRLHIATMHYLKK